MKRSSTNWMGPIFILLALFLWSAAGAAQEEKETPSQKTKEAVEKLKKAPALAGQGMEAVKQAGRAKLEEMTGGKAPEQAKVGGDPLAMPEKAGKPQAPRYSPAGKRDPFQPLALKTKPNQRPREKLSPLERYELGQLKVVGIVWDVKEPRAMVEDSAGLGYIVKVGTPIGPNEGKIKTIRPTEIVVEETVVDFYGAKKNQQVSMRLLTE